HSGPRRGAGTYQAMPAPRSSTTVRRGARRTRQTRYMSPTEPIALKIKASSTTVTSPCGSTAVSASPTTEVANRGASPTATKAARGRNQPGAAAYAYQPLNPNRGIDRVSSQKNSPCTASCRTMVKATTTNSPATKTPNATAIDDVCTSTDACT